MISKELRPRIENILKEKYIYIAGVYDVVIARVIQCNHLCLSIHNLPYSNNEVVHQGIRLRIEANKESLLRYIIIEVLNVFYNHHT